MIQRINTHRLKMSINPPRVTIDRIGKAKTGWPSVKKKTPMPVTVTVPMRKLKIIMKIRNRRGAAHADSNTKPPMIIPITSICVIFSY